MKEDFQQMKTLYLTVLSSFLLCVCCKPIKDDKIKTQNVELLMPNVRPQKPDTYLCHPMKMGEKSTYITGFKPHANMSLAHHILIYGCKEPGLQTKPWNCGEMNVKDVEDNSYEFKPVCADGAEIVYAWAMDAPDLSLPKDVGFKVGGDSEIQWLVLQVHYKNVDPFVKPNHETDHSGVTLVTTHQRMPKRAGVYLMGTGGTIPAHSTTYMETACRLDDDVTIHPFAFRAHAHTHGEVNSGYKIHNGRWIEIGRVSPKLPEMFYNITHPGITVSKGDILAARCTMVNNEDRDVDIGATQHDEMCNFYIMYYVEGPHILPNIYCFSPGPPNWSWKEVEGINTDFVPKDISVVPGTNKVLKESKPKSNEYDNEYDVLEADLDDNTLAFLSALSAMEAYDDAYNGYVDGYPEDVEDEEEDEESNDEEDESDEEELGDEIESYYKKLAKLEKEEESQWYDKELEKLGKLKKQEKENKD